MLDQNTDRMWYVIGAVIVGAGIILLANKMLPEVFANITDNMKGITDDATDEIDNIKVAKVNLLKYGHLEMTGGYYLTPTGRILSYGNPEFLRLEDLAPLFDKVGLEGTYTLSFEAKSLDTSQNNRMNVYMQSSTGSKYGLINRQFTVTEDWQSYTYTGLKPFRYTNSYAYENGDLSKPYDTAHLAFYGGYGTGNVPVVRNVSLIRE